MIRFRPIMQKEQFPRAVCVSVAAFIVIFAYGFVRYNVYHGVPYERIPLFINNKVLAVTSTALIALAYSLGPLARFLPRMFGAHVGLRKYLGLIGFGMASLHALISLLLLTPASYPKLFAGDGTMNFIGELSMLFGVLTFFLFALIAISSIPAVVDQMEHAAWLAVQRSGYFGILLIIGHVVVMGYGGWLAPEKWPGGLLPMSLIAFIIAATAIVLRTLAFLFPRKKS